MGDYRKELDLLNSIQFNELVLKDEDKELINLKVALIESLEKIHVFENTIKIRKMRDIPKSTTN